MLDVDGDVTTIERLGAFECWFCEFMELLVCDEFEVSLNTDVSSPFKSVAFVIIAVDDGATFDEVLVVSGGGVE